MTMIVVLYSIQIVRNWQKEIKSGKAVVVPIH